VTSARAPLLACVLAAAAVALLLPQPLGLLSGVTVAVAGPRLLDRLEPQAVRDERSRLLADLPWCSTCSGPACQEEPRCRRPYAPWPPPWEGLPAGGWTSWQRCSPSVRRRPRRGLRWQGPAHRTRWLPPPERWPARPTAARPSPQPSSGWP
jgi:hypothetical protein